MDKEIIKNIEIELLKKENVLDEVIKKNREIVRFSSLAIKAMHAKELNEAEKLLTLAEKELKNLISLVKPYCFDINHVMQEYAEAKIVLAVIKKEQLPSYIDLNVTIEAYLNGLLDSIGELKREMFESLRKGDKKEAEYYFKIMEEIYDSILHLKFSNALLPDFRRKQDAARIQIEQARGELL